MLGGKNIFLAFVASLLIVLSVANHAQAYELMTQSVQVQSGINLNVAFAAANLSQFEGGSQVVLLHGFPEGWYAWIDLFPQLLTLDDYSFIIPDLPAFNMSDQPADFASYNVYSLVDDLASLIQRTGQPITLVGHDWGGIISWVLAYRYPSLLNGLVILNSPHPSVWWNLIQTDPRQQNDSSYILFFESAEAVPALSANNFTLLDEVFGGESWFVAREDIYHAAWSQPNELNATLNYYRANIYNTENGWAGAETTLPTNATITVPTLVLWGTEDNAFALPESLDLLNKYVPNLKVETFNATHWIHHQIPEVIAPYIDNFIASNFTSSFFV
eukprot:TRINITY_DN1542_c0_g1_i1.p1 TRINITY_DN1542_c0_g1~~TRINITY_DN1542_c0_g1_i1.p1  ORF type:complete len:330 (+),score=70.33 TRINITY_DN1542_c0_g1_i1:220-1209(+)